MHRRRKKLSFENSREIGSYVDIQFEVSGENRTRPGIHTFRNKSALF